MVLNHSIAAGSELITEYRKIYGTGMLMNDGILMSDGMLMSDSGVQSQNALVGGDQKLRRCRLLPLPETDWEKPHID